MRFIQYIKSSFISAMQVWSIQINHCISLQSYDYLNHYKKHMKYLYMESHNTLQHIIEPKKITENEGERKGIGWLEELKVGIKSYLQQN